jgi:hypothetical protein
VISGLNTAESGHSYVNALGDNEGVGIGSRTPVHNSSVNHGSTFKSSSAGNGGGYVPGGANNWGYQGEPFGISVGPGTSLPTDTPAYLTVNYIVKY